MENTAAEEMYDFTKNRREKINLELSKIRSLYGREDVVYRFNAYKKAKDKDDIARKKGRSGYSGLPSARIELESACKSVGIEKTPDELIKDDSVIKTIHTRSEIISDQFLPILYKEYKNTPMTSDYMNRIIHRLTKSDTYIKKDDDDKTVYLVDSSCVEPFTKTLNEYAQMEDFPAISSTDTITKISVDGDKSYKLTKNADTSVWSVKGDGDEEKADSATVSSLVSSFGSMAYNSLADYKCEDKSKYGLDKPYATITVDYQEEVTDDSEDTSETADEATPSAEETGDDVEQDSTEATNTESDETVSKSTDEETEEVKETSTDAEQSKTVDKQLTILVGNKADDSNRYVMVNDSSEVYTMSEDTLSALTDKSEEDFWDMTVSYVSVNNLASLKVNYQGSDYKVNVSRETSTDDDGNDKETVTYKLNNSDLDETTFTTFYNKLINMAAQKRLTDKYEPDGSAELTATFTEEDGDTLEVAYYSYDTNYYAAVVDNKVYLVNKMNVKDLFTAFESVAEIEENDSDETKTEETMSDDSNSSQESNTDSEDAETADSTEK